AEGDRVETRVSAAHQTRDGLRGLGDLGIRLGVSGASRVDHAVPQVVVEEPYGDGVERALESADLREDVDAVLLLVDHARDASRLPLDAPQALEVAVLLGDVPVVVLVGVGHETLLTDTADAARPAGRADAAAVVAMLRKARSRRLLPTTNTLDRAMAAPASMGLSSPRAAIGMAATLYANAQNRFDLMVPRV